MRAPRIRARLWQSNVSLTKDEKPQSTGCSICRKICVDDQIKLLKTCNRLTRSASNWMKEIKDNSIIIYETYRCMPLLGGENICAPDWEEHVVRYHIVFDKKNS